MIQLDAYTAGEIPEPLEYTFQDSAGATITDIDDDTWTAVFRFGPFDRSSVTERDCTAAAGVVTHTWEDGDLDVDTTTVFAAEFTATNGTNTYISDRIVFLVRAAIPAPAS